MKKIHCYILHYERSNYLMEAINSVVNNGLRYEDITVLDNGSSVSTIESVRKILSLGVGLREAAFNKGFAWNFARCFNEQESEYLLALHDDDCLTEDFLTKQLSYLELNKGISLVGCNGYRIDSEGRRQDKPLLSIKNDGVKIFSNQVELGMHIFEDSCIPFSSILYRRSDIGPYIRRIDEIEERFGQCIDAAFLFEIVKVKKIALNTEKLYECRIHSNQDSKEMNDDWTLALMEWVYKSNKHSPMLTRKINEWYTFHKVREFYICIKQLQLENLLNSIVTLRLNRISISGVIKALRVAIHNKL